MQRVAGGLAPGEGARTRQDDPGQPVHRRRDRRPGHAWRRSTASSSSSASSTSRAARRPPPSATRSSGRARPSSLITCNLHSTEIGASQMVLELVHRLATEDSPAVRKILDNVILVLVPSANPDGQIMVVDWFNKNLGTEFEASPMPYLYHPYVGHDNNRDMYMLTQKESQLTAKLLWHDWFPVDLARRAPAGQLRRPHLRDARHRPDQPERPSADLPLERHPRAGPGGRARGGRQGRHHLQLDLHQLLAGRDGVERLVAQPGGPAHRGGQRRASRRRSNSGARSPGAPPAPEPEGGGRRQADTPGPLAAAARHHPAHRVPAAVDGRALDAARHRGLRADRDDGAARGGGGPARGRCCARCTR